MIQKLKGILFVLLMLLVFITIISLFIPSTISNAAAVVINAPADKIYTVLCDSSTWRQLRPSTAVIKNPISKDHVKTVHFFSTTFRPNDTESQVSILPIMEDELGYQVQWHSRVKLKWYPWEKFRGLFLEKVIGQAYESTLQNIKKILEAKPAN